MEVTIEGALEVTNWKAQAKLRLYVGEMWRQSSTIFGIPVLQEEPITLIRKPIESHPGNQEPRLLIAPT